MNQFQEEGRSMHDLLHGAFVWMMELVRDWGYAGVAFLMALESSIFPVPSEVVVPPAAFWATQGHMNIYLVVVAGTVGSWIGSAATYWVSYAMGRPLVFRYGRYFGFSPEKLLMAENWVRLYGTEGIFFARLLPVVRHLISIPAGICRMPFAPFSAATTVGAAIWCSTLAWFGTKIITPGMLQDAGKMVEEVKHQMHWIVLLICLIAFLYALTRFFSKRGKVEPSPAQIAGVEAPAQE
jgi:membrane protein DedA with SNARE-associated domain